LGGSSQLHCSHNNKDAHDPVDVGHQLGEKVSPPSASSVARGTSGRTGSSGVLGTSASAASGRRVSTAYGRNCSGSSKSAYGNARIGASQSELNSTRQGVVAGHRFVSVEGEAQRMAECERELKRSP
jgi:hypothetical protein